MKIYRMSITGNPFEPNNEFEPNNQGANIEDSYAVTTPKNLDDYIQANDSQLIALPELRAVLEQVNIEDLPDVISSFSKEKRTTAFLVWDSTHSNDSSSFKFDVRYVFFLFKSLAATEDQEFLRNEFKKYFRGVVSPDNKIENSTTSESGTLRRLNNKAELINAFIHCHNEIRLPWLREEINRFIDNNWDIFNHYLEHSISLRKIKDFADFDTKPTEYLN